MISVNSKIQQLLPYQKTFAMPYRLKHVHAYLLAQDKELALFDTGLNMPGAYETLEKDLASLASALMISDIFF
jgi:hypothetical protein